MKETQTEKFHDLLAGFHTAVLITHDEPWHFQSRPMAIAHVDNNCDLWFITGEDSGKVRQIEHDTRVHVVCQNGWTSCVTISGRATIRSDRDKIRALWKPSYQVWFPQGVEDPNITLIHVAGEQGEYWDNTGVNRLVYVFRAIKAIATGTTPDLTEGEQHGKLLLGPLVR